MTTQPAAQRVAASAQIAGEIRAELARQRISLRAYALRLGVDHRWVTRRLTKMDVPITLDDLQLMADSLGKPPAQFLQVWIRSLPRSEALPRLDSNQQPFGITSSTRRRTHLSLVTAPEPNYELAG